MIFTAARHKHPPGHADLRRRQPQSVRLAHQRNHARGHRLDRGIDLPHRLSPAPKLWRGVVQDLQSGGGDAHWLMLRGERRDRQTRGGLTLGRNPPTFDGSVGDADATPITCPAKQD